MGDMEDAEVRMLRRDEALDHHNDWISSFEYVNEPRQNLVSWLRFGEYCTPCDKYIDITRRGEHSYEGDCGHPFDRELVDYARAQNAAWREHENQMYNSGLQECPTHLVRVYVEHWHGTQVYITDQNGQRRIAQAWHVELSCGCTIIEQPQRKPCPKCPALEDGTMRAPRVIRNVTLDSQRDATTGYYLECHHTVIDF